MQPREGKTNDVEDDAPAEVEDEQAEVEDELAEVEDEHAEVEVEGVLVAPGTPAKKVRTVRAPVGTETLYTTCSVQ